MNKVLFRYCDDWEHIIIYKNGNLVSDGLENHRLSAIEILNELKDNGIIELEIEEMED